MSYQLVIQIAREDFRWLEEAEEKLISLLEPIHEVDGHDIGLNKTNIFILTNTPQKAFECSKKAFSIQELKDMKVAYRRSEGNGYVTIWPVGSHEEFKL